mmetsp:Transcript_42447/g.102240  ORF Transcript_42447/g.102240 Transcript_42447/m.102240 type:complete len:253 (-) Transcript_42447:99-857(-)
MFATPFTISGDEIPNPTAKGKSVLLRTRLMKSSKSGGSSDRAPVTPVTETQYKNVDAISVKAAIRLSLLVGATRGTLDKPCLMHALLSSIPSSGGRSTTMKPSAPASLVSAHNFSAPYWKNGLKYPIRTTGTVSPISRAFLTIAKHAGMSDVPPAIATWFVCWMVAPSACGSVYGIPSSMTDAPPSCMAKRRSGVSSAVGYPAVMNVTNAASFFSFAASNAASIRPPTPRSISATVIVSTDATFLDNKFLLL